MSPRRQPRTAAALLSTGHWEPPQLDCWHHLFPLPLRPTSHPPPQPYSEHIYNHPASLLPYQTITHSFHPISLNTPLNLFAYGTFPIPAVRPPMSTTALVDAASPDVK